MHGGGAPSYDGDDMNDSFGVGSLPSLPWWVLLFFGAGVLAILTAIMSLFFALGRRPPRAWATEIPDVNSREFLVGISAIVNSPLQSGGTIRLLNNGDEIFPAMLAAMRAAKRTINFAVYIWEPGKVSDQFFDVMIERARAGVEVRVLFDGLGGLRAPGGKIKELTEAGGRVCRFRPMRIGGLMRFHRRNHRRAIVVDGEVGFTGGAAVGDKWLGNARNPDEWRDTMVQVTGPLARSVQSAFVTLWAPSAGEMLMGDGHYPPHEAPAPGGEKVAYHTSVTSAPSSEDHPLRLFYMLSFLSARRTLYIATPYFVPDQHTRSAVASRARAGVDVRILLPNGLTDAKPIRQASHSYYRELLEAGVRIYEYQPAMMHSKLAVVDGVWSVVGSANMDVRSKELNQENVLGILDEGFGRTVQDTFLADLERAEEIRKEDWVRRGVWHHFKERVSVMFAEQY
jgi:cardiolipin synthase